MDTAAEQRKQRKKNSELEDKTIEISQSVQQKEID